MIKTATNNNKHKLYVAYMGRHTKIVAKHISGESKWINGEKEFWVKWRSPKIIKAKTLINTRTRKTFKKIKTQKRTKISKTEYKTYDNFSYKLSINIVKNRVTWSIKKRSRYLSNIYKDDEIKGK